MGESNAFVNPGYEDYLELKKLCEIHERGDTFEWMGNEILKEYGDHLIEFMERHFVRTF